MVGLMWSSYLLTTPALAVASPEKNPSDMIRESTRHLIDQLKLEREAVRQDLNRAYNLAVKHAVPHIDFKRTARLVLGRYWRTANDQQRSSFVNEFSTFLTRTYTRTMVEYADKIIENGENLRFAPFHAKPDARDAVVKMDILLEGRPPASVNYRLYKNGDGWKIFDISVEGVSLATTYRSSFATQINRIGMDALIDKLAKRNSESFTAAGAPRKDF